MKVLELGAGQWRYTLFFADNGFQVQALLFRTWSESYSKKVQARGISQSISALRHDVRQRFPFEDNFFDALYSNMLSA